MSTDMQDDKKQSPITLSCKKQWNTRTWILRGMFFFLFVLLLAGVLVWPKTDVVRGVSPPLSGLMLDGKFYQLASKPAQPVLVHFWATWCPTCKHEQGTIESLTQAHLNVITVSNRSGGSDAVQQYMVEQKLSFPVINDEDGQISKAWGVQGVPTSFIVDKDGKIRYFKGGLSRGERYFLGIGFRLKLWLAGF